MFDAAVSGCWQQGRGVEAERRLHGHGHGGEDAGEGERVGGAGLAGAARR